MARSRRFPASLSLPGGDMIPDQSPPGSGTARPILVSAQAAGKSRPQLKRPFCRSLSAVATPLLWEGRDISRRFQMRIDRSKVFAALSACLVLLASASYAQAATFTIGGTVSGLNTGTSVTLLDNGGNALKVTANGAFTFTTPLATGKTYKVTVGTQPTGEVCTVTNGTGTVGTANVTNVAVACKTTYTIGGTVSGLNTGTSVTLLDNGGNALKVTASGAFTFTTRLASGTAYKVTVSVQPTGEVCTVTNGTGTVGTANVTTVVVSCAAKTYTIGGTLSGLNSGASVTLLDNGGDSLTVTVNGKFTFKTALTSG